METIFATTYATLSKGYFELIFYTVCINEFCETIGHYVFKKASDVS